MRLDVLVGDVAAGAARLTVDQAVGARRWHPLTLARTWGGLDLEGRLDTDGQEHRVRVLVEGPELANVWWHLPPGG